MKTDITINYSEYIPKAENKTLQGSFTLKSDGKEYSIQFEDGTDFESIKNGGTAIISHGGQSIRYSWTGSTPIGIQIKFAADKTADDSVKSSLIKALVAKRIKTLMRVNELAGKNTLEEISISYKIEEKRLSVAHMSVQNDKQDEVVKKLLDTQGLAKYVRLKLFQFEKRPVKKNRFFQSKENPLLTESRELKRREQIEIYRRYFRKFKQLSAELDPKKFNEKTDINIRFNSCYKRLNECFEVKNLTTEEDFRSLNLTILEIMREFFSTPEYQDNKEKEDNPYIFFFHEFIVSIYQRTQFREIFSEFGQSIVKQFSEEGKSHLNVKGLVDYVDESQGAELESPYSWIDRAATKVNAAGSMSLAPFDYDPRKGIGNAVGTLFTKDVGNGKVHHVYTPSPTIGSKASPEFLAVLQAIQNQWKKGKFEKIGNRPAVWIYTNLQNRKGESNGERNRSKIIMGLNKEFPDAFKAISLTKDSRFYLDNYKKISEDLTSTHPNKEKTVFNYNVFFEEFRDELCNDKNFQLEPTKKSQKGGEYYFNPKDISKKELESILDKVQAEFNDELNDQQEYTQVEIWKKKAALKQVVYATIELYFQQKVIQDLEKKGVTDIQVNFTTACKECIDRGGAETAQSVFLSKIYNENLFLGSLFSRAILARHRPILKRRLAPFAAFLEIFGEERIKTIDRIQGIVNTVSKENIAG